VTERERFDVVVMLKIDATRIRRPRSPKDAFDLYAYARKKTPTAIAEALARATERDEALARLHELFAENGAGVLDVLSAPQGASASNAHAPPVAPGTAYPC
jgi:hypothetical protein